MANIPDRETLRALADEGNELALDRLADLADARDDVQELSDLLDEGCEYAGRLLTRRAVAARDLRELQRLWDAGSEAAGRELSRLLAAPPTGTGWPPAPGRRGRRPVGAETLPTPPESTEVD